MNFDLQLPILKKLWDNRGGILGLYEIKQSVDNITRQKISDNIWFTIYNNNLVVREELRDDIIMKKDVKTTAI
jgi:hypothetical protein